MIPIIAGLMEGHTRSISGKQVVSIYVVPICERAVKRDLEKSLTSSANTACLHLDEDITVSDLRQRYFNNGELGRLRVPVRRLAVSRALDQTLSVFDIQILDIVCKTPWA